MFGGNSMTRTGRKLFTNGRQRSNDVEFGATTNQSTSRRPARSTRNKEALRQFANESGKPRSWPVTQIAKRDGALLPEGEPVGPSVVVGTRTLSGLPSDSRSRALQASLPVPWLYLCANHFGVVEAGAQQLSKT